jgi:hypothetical protein
MLIRYINRNPLAERPMARTQKFCSECGEPINAANAGFLPARTRCEKCAPRFRPRRFLQAASLALLIVLAFIIGRHSAPQKTQYLLGTPIDPIANRPSAATVNTAIPANRETPATNAATARPSEPLTATTLASAPRETATGTGDDVVSICGARTKSGKICQRKVKGGGYCWQHRDKYGQKKANP